MLNHNGIGPTPPHSSSSLPREEPDEKGLRYYASSIHTTIGYVVKKPKDYERTFLDLAILMHMEERGVLSDEEISKITEEFQRLKEGLYDGSVKIDELPGSIDRLVQDTKKHNLKAEVISSIVELEHLICIYPPHGQEPRDLHEFNTYMEPIASTLTQSISPKLLQKLQKEIDEIKFFLSERGSIPEAFDKLADCKDLILREEE